MSEGKVNNYKVGSLPGWYPEDFGFIVVRQTMTMEGNIWRKGNFELRYQGNNIWLCRKNVILKGEPSIVVNFRKEVRPDDVEFAKMLLMDRLT